MTETDIIAAANESPAPLTAAQQRIFTNIHIVLIGPEDPANIGAVARAIKNTGFEHVILVQKEKQIPKTAFWVAHASEEILASAKIYDNLAEAVAPMRLVVGTTQRRRMPFFDLVLPEEAIQRALTIAIDHPVAFIFGRESRGLDNEELYQCNLWSKIPSPVVHPAFNLAQSVLIFTYTCYRQLLASSPAHVVTSATHQEWEAFYNRLETGLRLADFQSKDGMERFIARVRRVLNRVPLKRRDLQLLFKLLEIFIQKLKTVPVKPND